MRRVLASALVVGLVASAATAANLNIVARSGGSSNLTVDSGTPVNYELIGTLSDANNEGLALWGADLTLTCDGSVVPLDQGNTPVTPPMDNFVSSPTNTKGINNPAGYGGTPKDGKLLQAGGGQNTIKNTAANAPFPTGTPILGVAWPDNPATLLTGSFTPVNNTDHDIICTLSVTNVFANQIKQGETLDNVFLKTEAAGVGDITNLIVTVRVPSEDAILVGSSPACDSSLWQTRNNVVRLNFDRAVDAPQAGNVQVIEILANGAFGEDVSSQFNFAVEGGTTLRVQQSGDVGFPPANPAGLLKHRRWYAVRNNGWGGVADFAVHFQIQVGDTNNDGAVTGLDVSTVNGFLTCFNVAVNCPERIRGDVNNDNNVTGLDVSAINGRLTSFRVTKPTGHTCPE